MNRWIVALKFNSLPKIILPLLVGMAVASIGMEEVPWLNVALLLLYGFSLQNFIVLMNDVGDADADEHHMKHFPHLIDERMIPAGKITLKEMKTAGRFAAFGVLAVGAVATFALGLKWALLACAASLPLLGLYTFPPIKLNYRGGGEILEALGVGLYLPLIAGYIYSGSSHLPSYLSITPLLPLAFASALSSGLKHQPADKETGKKTFAVLFGLMSTKRGIVYCTLTALLMVGWLTWKSYFHWFMLPVTLLVPAVHFVRMFAVIKVATIENLPELAHFKKELHYLIFRMSAALAAAAMVTSYMS